ncbi:Mitotic-spindle organizing protein 1B [Tetrabaena socialis]|uniref:Mitotic-spindle organizing protein 1B n=1 Tax=Tetrabaena socialis TaxID=47790 RepID=A0A2J7ZKQ2_9CHLO|nr:Mitotic-spindle organizing protein 1B [Tetrabaena socialis]|eukprot:PNH00843.1 Mitotic-spindle organizing protein 1B [Tetrabaena socialis]
MEAGRTSYKAGGSKQDAIEVPHRAFEAALELSQILDTGLDKETLSVLLELLDCGVNPEALATVVRELRREATEYAAAVERVNVASGTAVASTRARQ